MNFFSLNWPLVGFAGERQYQNFNKFFVTLPDFIFASYRPNCQGHQSMAGTTQSVESYATMIAEMTDIKDMHILWLDAPETGCRADFTERDLSKWDFAGNRLAKSIFVSATLVQSNFAEAKLLGADFFAANLTKANFSHADLRKAAFCGAKLSGAIFDHANLEDADFRGGAMIPQSNQKVANNGATSLMDCVLNYANLSRANLSGANLQNTSFLGANMRDAKLVGADLSGTDFQSADLSGANLSNAQMSSAVFKDADLSGATLDGARFQDTVFENANFDGAKIDTMDLPLDWASGNGREVALALLQEQTNRAISRHEEWLISGGSAGERADFNAQDLSSIDFSNRKLNGSVFRGTILTGANFRSAVLVMANFSGAILRNSKFEGADLTGATLFDADLNSALLQGITVGPVPLRPKGAGEPPRQRLTDFRKADLRGASLPVFEPSQCRMTGAITD